MKTKHKPETLGRKYEREKFEIHFRSADGTGEWYSSPGMKAATLAEAKALLAKVGGRTIDLGGGFCATIQDQKRNYDYRIVRAVAQCEVVHLETRSI